MTRTSRGPAVAGLFALACVGALLPARPVGAATGDLVSGFSGDGVATVPGQPLARRNLALQDDGKPLVVTLGADGRPSLIRLTATGRRDTTFSGDGVLPLAAPGVESVVGGVAVDGRRIVVATRRGGDSSGVVEILRFTPTGRPDSTFSGDGRLIIDGPGRTLQVTDVAIGPDRSIVVLADNSGLFPVPTLSRVSEDGRLDRSFSGDGSALVPIPASEQVLSNSLDVDAAGDVVVSGSSISPASVTTIVSRVKADGRPLRSFGNGGFARVSVDGVPATDTFEVEFAAGGRVLGGGSTVTKAALDTYQYRMFAFRLTTDGRLDTGFAGDGTQSFDIGGKSVYGGEFDQQADGRIVMVGSVRGGTVGVVRLTANGRFDRTFSGDGRAVLSAIEARSGAVGVEIAPGERRAYVSIVSVVGESSTAGMAAVEIG